MTLRLSQLEYSLQNDNKNLAHTNCCWSRKQSNIQKLLRPTFEAWYLSCVNPATTMNTWGLKQMKEDWVKQGHASNLTLSILLLSSAVCCPDWTIDSDRAKVYNDSVKKKLSHHNVDNLTINSFILFLKHVKC